MVSFGKRIMKSLYKFVWGPDEVEFGDCVFYTILTLVLVVLIWLFTFELIGIPVEFSLIAWAAIVYAIWHQYYKTHPDKRRKNKRNFKGEKKSPTNNS